MAGKGFPKEDGVSICAAMEIHRLWTFASDAEIAAVWACGFLLVAGIAGYVERRRGKRRDIDRVGYVPWMAIFFASAFIGAGLLVMAIKGMAAG
ncbi:hypothetical protein [Qipengyuania atrilutea]|nr:hypothetical protein [Actirhodobacter atriluteus]